MASSILNLPAFEKRPWHTGSVPVLHLVGVPIGSPDEISLRALRVLRNCELLICESRKQSARLFKAWEIDFPRDVCIEWNEHSKEQDPAAVSQLVLKTQSSVYMSDQGMPVLADPGAALIESAREHGIQVDVIPGPTAMTTALCLAGWGNTGFRFLGFAPRKRQLRQDYIRELFQTDRLVGQTLVLYETPYRLHSLLEKLQQAARNTRLAVDVAVAVNLGLPDQYFWSGSFGDLGRELTRIPKGPPVVMLHFHSRRGASPHKRSRL
ncbi:MAG: hypothetical protein KDK39_05215 [Leptospiraceae bacterium]|nr:hypothetical protein [Leptospiraceae bacterium]